MPVVKYTGDLTKHRVGQEVQLKNGAIAKIVRNHNGNKSLRIKMGKRKEKN